MTMAEPTDPDLRRDLLEARDRIMRQIETVEAGPNPGYEPDSDPGQSLAELQAALREIEESLAALPR